MALDVGSTLGWHARGAAAFLQTFVHVAAPTKALLIGSTAGTGTFYLNGREVLPDLAYVGLHDAEVQGAIQLEAGWNRLSVKTLWHFGLGADDVAIGWAAFATLCSLSASPTDTLRALPGVIVTASAPPRWTR